MASSDTRPVFLFDGDCSFCRLWVEYWKQLTGDAVEYCAMQQASGPLANVLADHGRSSALLVTSDGSVKSGAEAVFSALAHSPDHRWPLWAYHRLPGYAAVAEAGYAAVARHRDAALRLTRLFWGVPIRPLQYALTSELFLRLLGVIYFIAFVSFGMQAAGLIGSDGILPIREALPAVRGYYGARAYWLLPTVLWLNASNTALAVVSIAGAAASVLLLLGVWKRAAGWIAFALYLSLVTAGQDFMGFQWDGLLLETGFLALLAARARAPIWMLRWLLFRLMFMSGAVKLLSGDATWRNLSALRYHFYTQPLPTPLAWYAQQLPASVQIGLTAAVLALELLVPFLIFLPRRGRFIAAFLLLGLQIGIFVTGNYAFFNLLAVLLCLPLLDDARVQRWLPTSFVQRIVSSHPAGGRDRWRILRVGVLIFLLLAGAAEMAGRSFGIESPIVWALPQAIAPLRIVNPYGLFAVMTTQRPEIIFEGSDDGVTWREYHFRWKPGDQGRAPRWVQPHQPRLDWQLWFAALGSYRQAPWTLPLMQRLLQGSPDVLALLQDNPFPNAPPRYVRAQLYRYEFTTWAERRQTGHWWRRELLGQYLPPLSLADLMRAGVR